MNPSAQTPSLVTSSARLGDGAAYSWRPWRWVTLALAALGPGWAWLVWASGAPSSFVTSNSPHGSVMGEEAWLTLLVSALAIGCAAVLLGRRGAARAQAVRWEPALSHAEQRLRPLGALPLVCSAWLDQGNILDPARLVAVMGAAALIGSADLRWCWRWLKRATWLGGTRVWSVGVLLVAYLLACAHLMSLAGMRLDGLHARAFDLGIYDNILFNTLRGDFLACSMIKGGVHTSAHFDPILGLLAPVYGLAPGAATASKIQIAWVLSGSFPAGLVASRRLGASAGLVAGLAWLSYPTVHGIALHDFHSYALLGPLLMWMVVTAERDRWFAFALVTALALSTREDAALCVMAVGGWLALELDRRGAAFLTIASAALYLAVVKLAVMPDPGLLMENSDEVYAYANRFRRLVPEGGGASDAAVSLMTNPSFIVGHVFSVEKLTSAALLLVPLACVPLLGGRRLWLGVWGVAFIYLSSKASIAYPLVHYSTALYPAIFAALPAGACRLIRVWEARHCQRERALSSVLTAVAAAAVLSGGAWGALRPNAAFKLHTETPWALDAATVEQAAWIRELAASIDEDTAVTASNRLGPFFSTRRAMYLPAQAQETPVVVVHRGDLSPADRRWIAGLVADDVYGVAARRGDITVYRRVVP